MSQPLNSRYSLFPILFIPLYKYQGMKSTFFIVPHNDTKELVIIDPTLIISCELIGEVVHIKMYNNVIHPIDKELNLFATLCSRDNFIRIKKGKVVNRDQILYHQPNEGCLLMRNGQQIKLELASLFPAHIQQRVAI